MRRIRPWTFPGCAVAPFPRPATAAKTKAHRKGLQTLGTLTSNRLTLAASKRALAREKRVHIRYPCLRSVGSPWLQAQRVLSL